MKIAIIAGARPNFIKIAPIIWACRKHSEEGTKKEMTPTVIYTGSEEDPTLEPSLFDDLQIPKPDVYLGVTATDQHLITAGVTEKLSLWLNTNSPDAVIVVDDLASTMAAAIVAKKQGLLLAHLVAGTRSFDINVPKEINRLVIDGLSDILFTAGVSSNSTAAREGVAQDRIYMVGNIIIDTMRNTKPNWRRPVSFDEMGIEDGKYILLTINRKKLLQDTAFLSSMIETILSRNKDVKIVAPLRPQAAKALSAIVPASSTLLLIDPLPYLEFSYAAANALGIITDSGNVAEEATFNGVPCATVNTYTEHIETVSQGSNRLVGEDMDLLSKAIADMIDGSWPTTSIPERWDGRTAERILQTIWNSKN